MRFKRKETLVAINFLLILPLCSIAQDTIDYRSFMESAREYSTLYRGELPPFYVDNAPNDGSTYFAYSITFEKGDMEYCGKMYRNIELNLNAHLNELYLREPFYDSYLVVNKNFVSFFSMGDRKYVSYTQETNSALKHGYYEVLYMGNIKLYKMIQKKYYFDIPYGERRVRKGYKIEESFYVCKGDTWRRVGKIADLKKLFPEQKGAIDYVLRTKRLNFVDFTERSIVEIVTYLDSL